MYSKRRPNDSMKWFLEELTSRIVAESGNPSDRFHLGKLVLQSLKDAPDFIHQIDGSTDARETNSYVLERSVRCAVSLKNMGISQGDVVMLMAPNHLDLVIPIYATWSIGAILATCDKTLGIDELQYTLNMNKPSIIFCQSEKLKEIEQALHNLDLRSRIVTFDEDSFTRFLKESDDVETLENFKASDVDPESTGLLVPTSGSTGIQKAVALSYKTLSMYLTTAFSCEWNFPTPLRMTLNCSTIQWMSGIVQIYASTVFRMTRLQSSMPYTVEHIYELINTYRPEEIVISPPMFTALVKSNVGKCDFSCFKVCFVGGSAVPQDVVKEFKTFAPETDVLDAYGMTETCGVMLQFSPDQPPKSNGIPMRCFQYRLVDIVTGQDINEPNVSGELWVKGPGLFKEYYNNIDETKAAFSQDGWLKTGDLFYVDKHNNFFFVDRIKMMLKYKNHQISPVEIENVIRRHEAVFDVAVTGVKDSDGSDLPVACVVLQPNSSVTAQDIINLAKESLTDSKQLRGGVVFLKEMPMTVSTKIDRRKLKEIVLNLKRET